MQLKNWLSNQRRRQWKPLLKMKQWEQEGKLTATCTRVGMTPKEEHSSPKNSAKPNTANAQPPATKTKTAVAPPKLSIRHVLLAGPSRVTVSPTEDSSPAQRNRKVVSDDSMADQQRCPDESMLGRKRRNDQAGTDSAKSRAEKSDCFSPRTKKTRPDVNLASQELQQKKKIEQLQETIQKQRKKIQEQQVTIQEQEEMIQEQDLNMQEQQEKIEQQEQSIQEQQKTIQLQQLTIDLSRMNPSISVSAFAT